MQKQAKWTSQRGMDAKDLPRRPSSDASERAGCTTRSPLLIPAHIENDLELTTLAATNNRRRSRERKKERKEGRSDCAARARKEGRSSSTPSASCVDIDDYETGRRDKVREHLSGLYGCKSALETTYHACPLLTGLCTINPWGSFAFGIRVRLFTGERGMDKRA